MSLLTADMVQAWVPQADGKDALVYDAIAMAEEAAAEACGRPLEAAARTERYTIGERQASVQLEAYPVDTTATFTVRESANTTTPATVDAANYTVDADAGILHSLWHWWQPGTRNLEVTYTAGYTTATLPAGLRRALLQLVAWMLETRGNVGTRQESVDGASVTYEEMDGPVPVSISRALQPYKAVRIG